MGCRATDARIEQGTVFIEGRNIYDKGVDPKAVRKYVGIIHQRPIVFPMSIIENVLFHASCEFSALPVVAVQVYSQCRRKHEKQNTHCYA